MAGVADPAERPEGRLRGGVSGWGKWAVGAAFLVAALNLRPAIAAVGPLLPLIRTTDHLSAVEAGLLTSMPLVCFGALALFAPRLVRKAGTGALLLACLAALVGSIVLRSVPSLASLYLGTLGIGVAIAIANVLMPGVVKRDFPGRVALMTGLYTTMLSLGPAVGAAVSVPLEHALKGSWRLALGVWALPAAVALVCWLPFRRHDPPAATGSAALAPRSRLLRSPVAWTISLYMGLQSLNFYTILAWLPTILQHRGVSVVDSGSLLGAVNLVAVCASLGAPWLSERLGSQRVAVLLGVLANAGGLLGLIVDGHHLQLLWGVLIGIGQGSAISLAMMLMVVRAEDAHEATSVSGMAQGVGYLIAAFGPVAAGALFTATRTWDAPIAALIVLLAVQAAAGWHAGKRGRSVSAALV